MNIKINKKKEKEEFCKNKIKNINKETKKLIDQYNEVIKNYRKILIKEKKIVSKLINFKLKKQKLIKELKRSYDNNNSIRKR